MKLIGSTKGKITKNENGKNLSHLEITEVVLVHCNIVSSNYQHDLNVLYIFAYNTVDMNHLYIITVLLILLALIIIVNSLNINRK